MKILSNKKLNFRKSKQKSDQSNNSTGSSKSLTKQLIRRIIFANILSLIIIVGTYFWMIYFLSNVGSFWDLFRDKEVYVQSSRVAPNPPFLTAIPEATQEESIDISGSALAGIRVILYIDDARADEIVSDSGGSFSFTNIPVTVFQQKIYVTAVDENGNESRRSSEYSVIRDTEPPELVITAPSPGEVVRATGHSYRVTGTTEAGSTVFINGQLAVVNPQGEFFASIRLEEGDNSIRVVATDRAGNETEKFTNAIFEKID